MRLAIYVPTYQAESTVHEAIERSALVAAELGAVVLVQDDASTDETVSRAREAAHGSPHVDVSANPVNLGYGGNLKQATMRAADRGCEAVAMVHGDLQYRPEDVPAMVGLLDQGADLVFGSRMLGCPLAGGMPKYKWLGNRALTAAVNCRYGTRLTDPHTGLVVFSLEAAKAIELDSCSDGHEISADMCLRALAVGLMIQEVPIPTIYGPQSRSCSWSTSVRYGMYLLRSLRRRPQVQR